VEWLVEPGGVTAEAINYDELTSAAPTLSNVRMRPPTRQPADLTWVLDVVEMTSRPSQDQLVVVISSVRQHIRREEFDLLSQVLSSLVVRPDLSVEAIIALLRSSYAGRRKIPGWKRLVATARACLEKRHLPSKELLVGL